MQESEREQLQQVIGDFIELGHVENIVSMFKADPDLYALCGELIRDERFVVRIGMALLFEELVASHRSDLLLAIPALAPLLAEEVAHIRGEAANLLAIIGGAEVREYLLPLLADPDPQVREIARDGVAEK